MSPLRIGGISVPAAEHNPQPMAKPSPTPRYRIIRPHVSPPTPHIAPHATQKPSSLPGAWRRTDTTFDEVASANTQGTTTKPTIA
jgi:hypothetical protein